MQLKQVRLLVRIEKACDGLCNELDVNERTPIVFGWKAETSGNSADGHLTADDADIGTQEQKRISLFTYYTNRLAFSLQKARGCGAVDEARV